MFWCDSLSRLRVNVVIWLYPSILLWRSYICASSLIKSAENTHSKPVCWLKPVCNPNGNEISAKGKVITNYNKYKLTQMSFICHIHNYTEYNEEWNVFSAFNPAKCTHTWSSGQPTLQRPGNSWGFGALLMGLTSVVDTSWQSRDLNPQPWVTLGFKSNALSIRPRLPPN